MDTTSTAEHSLSHSQDLAAVALIEQGWTVGVDAEPFDRPPASTVYDMMARGEELEQLKDGTLDALWAWTSKEAIQKLLGKECISIPEILFSNRID